MFEIGMKVKLLNMGYLGKATSPFGKVVAVNRHGELKVIRDGIKTPQWYCAGDLSGQPIWAPADIEGDQFRESIRSNPWDWFAYLAYADYLEERGADAKVTHTWRWMGQRQKKPLYNGMSGISRRWTWLLDYQKVFHPSSEEQAAALPRPLMVSVSRDMFGTGDRYAFQTDDQAIEALARGLHTLKEIAS